MPRRSYSTPSLLARPIQPIFPAAAAANTSASISRSPSTAVLTVSPLRADQSSSTFIQAAYYALPMRAITQRVRDTKQRRASARELRVEAYGVGIALGVERAAVLDQVHAILPPGWCQCTERNVQVRFKLASLAPDRIFVHEGVHPYPKPLSIRNGGSRTDTTETLPSELGALTAARSARIGLIALTSYKPEASWQPQTGTVADAALALFSHAVVAREQPERVLSVVSRAAGDAHLLEGERGEAEPTARALLDALAD